MVLADPWALLLLLLLIPLAYGHFRGRRAAPLPFPSAAPLRPVPSRFVWLRHVPFVLRAGAIVLIAIAAARPQKTDTEVKRTTEGLDIVLVLDTSRSMEARDFVIDGKRPTRLEVVKKVITDFIAARPSDRIGMVVFGTEAFTQAPLTLDHDVLLSFLSRISISVAGDATAIGDGLGTAAMRLKEVDAKSKIVILLTDGSNTAGRLDPLVAAQAAKALGIKVYTIGVGSKGTASVVVNGRLRAQQFDIDEELLQKIADLTGGKYFRATDTETLIKVYETIDKLEKTEMKVSSYTRYEERYAAFVWPALVLLVCELAFGITRFRRIP